MCYKNVQLPTTDIKTKDCKLSDWSDGLAHGSGMATVVGDGKEEDSHSPPVYYYEISD